MGIGDAVKPVQTVTIDELASKLASKFGKVTWGEAGVEGGDAIEVALQLVDMQDEILAKPEIIRLTCTATATMALAGGGVGTVLSGTGTADMIIELDAATGTFDLEVTDVNVGTITVVGGVTQGSGIVDCKNIADLVFA